MGYLEITKNSDGKVTSPRLRRRPVSVANTLTSERNSTPFLTTQLPIPREPSGTNWKERTVAGDRRRLTLQDFPHQVCIC